MCELIERAVLIKEPVGLRAHARAFSSIPTLLSFPPSQSPKLLLFHGVGCQWLVFCLVKSCATLQSICGAAYCWIVEMVSCPETLAQSSMKQNTLGFNSLLKIDCSRSRSRVSYCGSSAPLPLQHSTSAAPDSRGSLI